MWFWWVEYNADLPTELTERHFVYWKSTSSPGSHPTENRTCRKDLWAAFVFIFYRLFLFPIRLLLVHTPQKYASP